MFKKYDHVVTNDKYFERFGRRVYGTVYEHDDLPKSDHVVVVRWDNQIGNYIPEHQGNLVIMMADDLELYKEEGQE